MLRIRHAAFQYAVRITAAELRRHYRRVADVAGYDARCFIEALPYENICCRQMPILAPSFSLRLIFLPPCHCHDYALFSSCRYLLMPSPCRLATYAADFAATFTPLRLIRH